MHDASKNSSAATPDVLWQFVRYGITGGGVTLCGVALYWGAVTYFSYSPLFATFLAYLLAVSLGYVIHSRFSFRGHGSRDNLMRTTSRFFGASLLSYALNSFFVWLLTSVLGGPAWWGIPPMVFITPIIIFLVNRRWVFS
jgi:putative flippase GtrA